MNLNYLPTQNSPNIPPTSLYYIDKKIAWFSKVLGLSANDWPLDCFQLLKRIKSSQCINFDYDFLNLPLKCDAVSVYISTDEVYLMQVNRNKISYPFANSRDRRMNFTIAHELGHIVLGHLRIPRNIKSESALKLEELEADEFAGRFLMPAEIIYSCNFYSLDRVAAYFNVSKSALWTRMSNMNRLDLLNKRKVPTCNCCGNTSFSPFAEYCGICGQMLRGNLQGIRRILYPEEIPMDRYKRVIQCPNCHAEGNFDSGDQCIHCGTHIFNYCSDFFNDGFINCTHANNGNHRYCELCGRTTYFAEKGFLTGIK